MGWKNIRFIYSMLTIFCTLEFLVFVLLAKSTASTDMKLSVIWLATFVVNIGVQASDDVEVQRQRIVLLLVHYLFFFVGPFSNIMLFLGSGMYHSAMMTAFVSLLLTLLSYFLLCTARRCLCFCTYVITTITFVAPFSVCTFAGGVVNSGFVPQLMFFSPLTWLCTLFVCGARLPYLW